MGFFVVVRVYVNRHTGGLERTSALADAARRVNRHTGGLEMNTAAKIGTLGVNRHTGGLEIF